MDLKGGPIVVLSGQNYEIHSTLSKPFVATLERA
jgi:hypothetical protein